MSLFRSEILKNNTLIEGNLTNNSQNPVSEISYGTTDKFLSRLIFDINFDNIVQRINEGHINPNNFVKHVLHMTNTIRNASEYVGRKSYSSQIERASSFDLELFNVSEDWDEGSGYDFIYNNEPFPYIDEANSTVLEQASNWYYRKTNIPWTISGGSYQSGVTEIFGTQRFEKGNEDIEIDITDYVNGRLVAEGVTGLTGYTGTTYGLGLKFTDDLEELETIFRQAVAFHVKNTHTFYEPYIETTIDDTIIDDRNYFYLDKDNDLYLYVNVGGQSQEIIVNNVEIYDYEENLVATISGDSITNVRKGVYKTSLNISSEAYPDAVLFTDKWNVTINDKNFEHENQFYLISSEKYYTFDQSNQIELSNYVFNFWGISQLEKIVSGDIRKIKIGIKELYANQNNFLPLDVEYRVYTTVGDKYEIDIIPFTSTDRTSKGYEFNLDTSWLIPQDYYLQLRLKNGNYYENKKSMKFTVISNGIVK